MNVNIVIAQIMALPKSNNHKALRLQEMAEKFEHASSEARKAKLYEQAETWKIGAGMLWDRANDLIFRNR